MTEHVSEPRRVHLPGTIPADTPRQGMELMAATVGPHLRTMSGAEITGGRSQWIIPILDRRERRPEVIVLRKSRLHEPVALNVLTHPPLLMARPGRKITVDTMCLEYATYATQEWPIFRDVTKTHDLPDVVLQVGVPSPFNLAVMGAIGPVPRYALEVKAALREINTIHAVTGGRVVYQLEVVLELVGVAKAPAQLRAKVADWMFRRIGQFIALTPQDSQWIIHLCCGNKNNEPMVSLTDVEPLVVSTEAVVRHWPQGRGHVLNAVHWPIGDSHTPPPRSEAFWVPGTRMNLPLSVHLSLGLAHPGLPLDYLVGALHVAENTLGRGRLGVSTSCGEGRRPLLVGHSLNMLAALAVA